MIDLQLIEAMISLMFLLVATTFIVSSVPSHHVDDSLYRLQLANDVWRVLYLRDDFRDFSLTDPLNPSRTKTLDDIHFVGEESSLCIFIRGGQLSNCAFQNISNTVSVKKLVIADGQPEQVTLSIAIKE